MTRIFDAHCDTVYELCEKNQSLFENKIHLDIKRMKNYDTYIQIFAAFIDKENIKTSPMKECLRLIEKYRAETKKNRSFISHIETLNDLKKSADGGVYSILSIEGGEALGGDLSAIKMYYDLGVRLITLTWNYSNELADGICAESGGGLTEFGKKAIKIMEKLGIVIDVSHLSEKGFWDVAKYTTRPFVASHSCVKSLCSHKRNLTDEQIAEIINRKGCIGINFYPQFISDDGKCCIADICTHIKYILDMGGEDCVGLGSDFDGISYLPRDMSGAENMNDLIFCMTHIGISDEVIDKISFGNFYRVFYDILSN